MEGPGHEHSLPLPEPLTLIPLTVQKNRGLYTLC